MAKSWQKQARDQILHLIWAFTSAALLVSSPYTFLLGAFSTTFIIIREWLQWPSYRTMTSPFWRKVGGWDPWLDWSFYALGFAAGVVVGIRVG